METQIINRAPTFVTLNNKLIAKYVLIFRINDSYSITDFSKFIRKQQLFFQKIENKNQQLNLMFVDSVFVNILADLTLEVLVNKITSFKDYISSSVKIKLVDEADEDRYFTYKFSDFIHRILFSDISRTSLFRHQEFTDRVFCLRNKFGELEYFSIYDRNKLQSKLLTEMKIEIDYKQSSISKQEAKVCLKFSL